MRNSRKTRPFQAWVLLLLHGLLLLLLWLLWLLLLWCRRSRCGWGSLQLGSRSPRLSANGCAWWQRGRTTRSSQGSARHLFGAH